MKLTLLSLLTICLIGCQNTDTYGETLQIKAKYPDAEIYYEGVSDIDNEYNLYFFRTEDGSVYRVAFFNRQMHEAKLIIK